MAAMDFLPRESEEEGTGSRGRSMDSLSATSNVCARCDDRDLVGREVAMDTNDKMDDAAAEAPTSPGATDSDDDMVAVGLGFPPFPQPSLFKLPPATLPPL